MQKIPAVAVITSDKHVFNRKRACQRRSSLFLLLLYNYVNAYHN